MSADRVIAGWLADEHHDTVQQLQRLAWLWLVPIALAQPVLTAVVGLLIA